jgi:hypothetical protein
MGSTPDKLMNHEEEDETETPVNTGNKEEGG